MSADRHQRARYFLGSIVFLAAAPWLLYGQQFETNAHEVDDDTSPIGADPSDSIVLPTVPPARAPAPIDSSLLWNVDRFIESLLRDQRTIWTSPVHFFTVENRTTTVAAILATSGLILLDAKDTAFFRRTNAFDGFNHVLPGDGTQWGLATVPVSLYAFGAFRRDSYLQTTARMSIEALIDGEFATTVLKDLDRRVRPIAVQGNHFANSWFQDDGNGITGTGSFPSGHAMAAFAIASVISRRYGHRRWIPFMAYGIASAIGLSRVTLCSHFSSDVFAGAVLGELIGQKLPLGERTSP